MLTNQTKANDSYLKWCQDNYEQLLLKHILPEFQSHAHRRNPVRSDNVIARNEYTESPTKKFWYGLDAK